MPKPPMIPPRPDDGRSDYQRFDDAVGSIFRTPKTEANKSMSKKNRRPKKRTAG